MKTLSSITRTLNAKLGDWSVVVARYLGRRLARSVSTNYRLIGSENASIVSELRDSWKERSLPSSQRTIVNAELKRMQEGDVIRIYSVLADAIRRTGCENGKIIEVGCASGYYYEVLHHLLRHEVNYIGIDYSEPMVLKARSHYPDTAFMVGDAAALPLGNKTCDVLVSGCVILHVPDYENAIAESARVSREWVIFHRTPIGSVGPTRFYSKLAYGVQCVEIVFAETELFDMFRKYGLSVVASLEIANTMRTYVCRK